MEEVGYAEAAYADYVTDDGDVDVREPSPIWPNVAVATRFEPVVPRTRVAPVPDDDPTSDVFGPLMQRALGEQIAEQRMIREALMEFDRRVEVLERSTAERMTDLEHDLATRLDHFEHTVTERMAAFEAVLKRIVDRVTGFEERVTTGLDHTDKVVRAQLDSIRPSFETAVERVVEWVEQLDGANAARLTALRDVFDAHLSAIRPTIEAVVQASISPPIERVLTDVHDSLDATERKIRRDVNRLAHAIHGEAGPFRGFEPVSDDPEEALAANPTRRRERPLRAHPDGDEPHPAAG